MSEPHAESKSERNLRMYSDIGRELARDWGAYLNDGGIKGMDHQSRVISILAAIHRRLEALNEQMFQLLTAKNENRADHPSDGMLEALQPTAPDVEICSDKSLSTRARRAVLLLGETKWSKITKSRLAGLKNCGPCTINELMRRKAQLLGRKNA